MKKYLTNSLIVILALIGATSIAAQDMLDLHPEIGENYIYSDELMTQWSRCDSLAFDLYPEGTYTDTEFNQLFDKCMEMGYSEACDGPYGIICGCSWYCGAMYTKVETSSFLASRNDIRYDAQSISDFNNGTAWVEGVDGDGIGETILFEFPPLNPRITEVVIDNGYVKDSLTWKNNGRVKTLKMVVYGKPYALLHLKDVYAKQTFKVSPIGFSHREHVSYTQEGVAINDMNGEVIPPIVVKFEIIETYPGDKYKDTAISEISFKGIDVH